MSWIHVRPRLRHWAIGATAAALAGPANAQSFLEKAAGAVRIVTWNIAANSIFQEGPNHTPDLGRPAQFRRVMRALKPDVVCLQEATRGADAARALMNSVLPLGAGGMWHAHAILGNVLLTRFELTHSGEDVVSWGERRRGHAAGLVDLPAQFAGDLYVICAHFESRSGDDRLRLRNLQADAIVDRIADARTPGGRIDMPAHTSVIVLGDLNVVDSPAPYIDRLVAAQLTDLLPRHNARGEDTYTWRVDDGRFPPNALDRILVGGESLRVAKSFVLNTTNMTTEELRSWDLRAVDVMRDPRAGILDHLPVVADLVPSTARRGAARNSSPARDALPLPMAPCSPSCR